jgi:NAD(P)-dependent dehydrogenase (short-subunit alcohol dehydrogenase family)
MSDNYFQGKVIAITGGASGMGLETARYLSCKGAKISICDINEAALHKVETELNCIVHATDVRKQDQVDAWIQKTVDAYGKLDGVANLAAVIGKDIMLKPTEKITTEDWELVLGINLTGMMNCLRAEIPQLNANAAIVNFASVSGQRGFENNGAYCASKFGVIGLSKCAAKELGPKGVRLNIVCP